MRTVMKKAMTWALICGACAFTATSSWGVTVNLRAEQVIKTVPLPGGGTTNILMWGFALDSAAPGRGVRQSLGRGYRDSIGCQAAPEE